MLDLVVDPGNRLAEPTFHLVQSHCRGFFRIEIAFLCDVRVRRPGQEMDLPHHGADQPFNVTAVMRRANRPVSNFNTVLLAAPTKRFGSKFLGIVEMKALG